MAYTPQSFNLGQVLTAAQVQQLETNIRDHPHGSSGVSGISIATIGISASFTVSLQANSGTGVTVTHSLQTNNIKMMVMALGSLAGAENNWHVGARRPDGAIMAVAGATDVVQLGVPNLPSSGSVRFLIKNGTAGAQGITVYYSFIPES